MNDEQLHHELQTRIPSAGPNYWDSIDSRLAEIEESQDFAETDTDIGTTVTRLKRVDPETPASHRRHFAAAAALILVLALSAVALVNRPGAEVTSDLDLATQPEPDGSQPDLTESDQAPEDEAQADQQGGTATGDGSGIDDSAGGTDAATDSMATAFGTLQASLANELDSDEAFCFARAGASGMVTIWPDGSVDVIMYDPAWGSSNPRAGSAAGNAQGVFAMDLVEVPGAGETPGAGQTVQFTLTDDAVTVGNTMMVPGICPAGPGAGAPPPPASAVPQVSVRRTIATRLAAPDIAGGNVGPFCFRSALTDPVPTIGSVTVGSDATLDIRVWSGDDVIWSYAALVAGSPDIMLDDVEFFLVNVEGAVWGDTTSEQVTLTDELLVVDEFVLLPSQCADDQSKFDLLDAGTLKMRQTVTYGITSSSRGVWRLIEDGAVNVRQNPGLASEVISTVDSIDEQLETSGRQAEVDGFVWIELQASESRPVGWIAAEFAEEVDLVTNRECYRNSDTILALEWSEDRETFVGSYATGFDGSPDYVAVAGTRFVGTAFQGTLFQVQSEPVDGPAVQQEWGSRSDAMLAASLGQLEASPCGQAIFVLVDMAVAITSYPKPPPA